MPETKVIVIPEGKICDYVDGKFRNDTPEEYVRQTIEKRLVNEHKYSPKQIRIEYTLQLGSRKPRADIVIFKDSDTEQTQNNIYLIIECKKETVDARNAKDGVEQLKSYMSACPSRHYSVADGNPQNIYTQMKPTQKFYKMPQALFSDKYSQLSNDAKILYMLLLDRKSLSEKNHFNDENGNTVVLYSKVYLFFCKQNVNKYKNLALQILCSLKDKTNNISVMNTRTTGDGFLTVSFLLPF